MQRLLFGGLTVPRVSRRLTKKLVLIVKAVGVGILFSNSRGSSSLIHRLLSPMPLHLASFNFVPGATLYFFGCFLFFFFQRNRVFPLGSLTASSHPQTKVSYTHTCTELVLLFTFSVFRSIFMKFFASCSLI